MSFGAAGIGLGGEGFSSGDGKAGLVTDLTDVTFDEEVGAADLPLVVDFWAEWCGPCRMVAPVLAQIAKEQEGKLRFAKVNVDDAPSVARRYDIMSIPTLIVFKNGVAEKRIVGAKGKGQLVELLSEFL